MMTDPPKLEFNHYMTLDPDELVDQGLQCLGVMQTDPRFKDAADLLAAHILMIDRLVAIAREKFNDGTWVPPPPHLELLEGGKKDDH